jgi:hypothetical protein
VFAEGGRPRLRGLSSCIFGMTVLPLSGAGRPMGVTVQVKAPKRREVATRGVVPRWQGPIVTRSYYSRRLALGHTSIPL